MAQNPSAGGGERPNAVLIQKAAEGGKVFVDRYYPDVLSNRSSIARYYTPQANISWNGNVYQGGASFGAFLQTMPSTHFEVQDYDAQPIVPNQQASATSGETTCRVLLLVSGYVKFGDEKTAPARGFSESIILAPDPAVAGNFLVEHQSFRIVV